MRRPLYIGAACVAVLLGAWGLYELFFHDEPPPAAAKPPAPRPVTPPAPPPAPEPATTFEIAEVAGTVEVKRGDTWSPVKTGDRLGTADAIRTGPNGRATLRGEGGDELTLRERVELELGRLSQKATELSLRRGKLRARAAAGTERLAITSGEAQAVGKGGGRFTVFADPEGAVTVASESGDTEVIAQGARVTVGTGRQTYVPRGEKPGDPVPVPDEVFLQVAWPAGEVHTQSATVRGKARPGTTVMVNGREAPVRRDGSFAAIVPVQRGENAVSVVAESIDGKTRSSKGQVRVNLDGPPLEAKPEDIYKMKRREETP